MSLDVFRFLSQAELLDFTFSLLTEARRANVRNDETRRCRRLLWQASYLKLQGRIRFLHSPVVTGHRL